MDFNSEADKVEQTTVVTELCSFDELQKTLDAIKNTGVENWVDLQFDLVDGYIAKFAERHLESVDLAQYEFLDRAREEIGDEIKTASKIWDLNYGKDGEACSGIGIINDKIAEKFPELNKSRRYLGTLNYG